MKPSDILITGPCPLTGTFWRTEAEQCAALMIFVLAKNGDSWRAVTAREIGEVLRDILAAAKREVDPVSAPLWMNNPTFRPDPDTLVERGACTWGEGDRQVLVFTEAGLERLRSSRWNRAAFDDAPKEEP